MILRIRGGDFNSFFNSCIVFFSAMIVLWIFFRLGEPVWSEQWGSFLTREVREHSAIGTMGWKAFHRTTLYPMFLLLPVLWMFSAFCLQRVLPAGIARIFNRTHSLLLLALALTVALAFLALNAGPG